MFPGNSRRQKNPEHGCKIQGLIMQDKREKFLDDFFIMVASIPYSDLRVAMYLGTLQNN